MNKIIKQKKNNILSISTLTFFKPKFIFKNDFQLDLVFMPMTDTKIK